MLLGQITPEYLSLSLFLLVLNIPLFLYGWKNLIVNRFQVAKMKDLIHEIDPSAYITISEVADVFSANFDIKNLPAKDSSSEKVPLK